MSEGLERPDRLARLREAAGKMEEALRDEGFDEQGSHGVFVRWQRQTVEELGQLLVEAERTLGQRVEAACVLMENRRGSSATTNSVGRRSFSRAATGCWRWRGRRR